MRTLSILLLAAACAPDGTLDPSQIDARQKGEADGDDPSGPVGSEGGEEEAPAIVGSCIDRECTGLYLSTEPYAGEGTWLLDGAEVGYGKGYKYAHDFDRNFAEQEFLPDRISGTRFYDPGNNARENELRKYLKNLWNKKYGY